MTYYDIFEDDSVQKCRNILKKKYIPTVYFYVRKFLIKKVALDEFLAVLLYNFIYIIKL